MMVVTIHPAGLLSAAAITCAQAVLVLVACYRDEEKCGHCPKRNISTWKNEDVEFNVLFENSSALVQFSLENMNSVGWMDFVDLEVQVDRYKTVY